MRPIKARRKQALGDIGAPAPVSKDNFVTLTEPAFKPKLELIDATHEEGPDLSKSNIPEGSSLNEDKTRPSAENIANGLHEENLGENGDVKPDVPPHAKENTKQDNNRLDEDQVDLSKYTSHEDFKMRYKLAAKLADIKVSAGHLKENQRDNFIDHLSDHFSVEQIESTLQENQQWAETMQRKASVSEEPQSPRISRSPVVPTTSGSLAPGLKTAQKDGIDILDVILS